MSKQFLEAQKQAKKALKQHQKGLDSSMKQLDALLQEMQKNTPASLMRTAQSYAASLTALAKEAAAGKDVSMKMKTLKEQAKNLTNGSK